MRESSKKAAKFNRMIAIVMAFIVVISVVLWLIGQYAVGSEKLGFRAILILFACLFGLTGLFLSTIGFVKKSASMLIFGGPSLTIGMIFFLSMFKVKLLAIIIICIALLILTFIVIYAFKTPELVLETDNDPEAQHKTYAEKKKEAELQPKVEEKVELPELKSFKDQ